MGAPLAASPPVDIPSDRDGVERSHEIDGLPRKRSRGDIAAEDDRVDAFAFDLCEHSLKGRQVAVHVVERGEPHSRTPTATSGADSVRPENLGDVGLRRPASAKVVARER